MLESVRRDSGQGAKTTVTSEPPLRHVNFRRQRGLAYPAGAGPRGDGSVLQSIPQRGRHSTEATQLPRGGR